MGVLFGAEGRLLLAALLESCVAALIPRSRRRSAEAHVVVVGRALRPRVRAGHRGTGEVFTVLADLALLRLGHRYLLEPFSNEAPAVTSGPRCSCPRPPMRRS